MVARTVARSQSPRGYDAGMSSLFAEYRERDADLPPARPPEAMAIGVMTGADADAVASIRAERDGGALSTHLAWARSSVARQAQVPDELQVVVARDGGHVLAYASAVRLAPSADAPSNAIPTGLYLGGIVVRPELRRRGIGRALTRWRMDWIFERAAAAYYFQNEHNAVSTALHEEFGFREVRRGIWAPGCTFTGGVGVLYRAERPA